MKSMQRGPVAILSCLLAGCASDLPLRHDLAEPVAARWEAPLPHGGTLETMAQWWQSQGDPLLAALMEAAQLRSPTVAAAHASIAQARAELTSSKAALLPGVTGSASIARGSDTAGTTVQRVAAGAVQATLPIDLFGGAAAQRDAADARLAGAGAAWHMARVSLAAELATQYYTLRTSQQLLEVAQADAASRANTARLTQLKADAGLLAPATLALAKASDAEGASLVIAARARCDVLIKALVALSGMDEGGLRHALAAGQAAASAAPALAIPAVPASLLSRRPDVFIAERTVQAARYGIAAANASRYPQLSLSGSIGASQVRLGGAGMGQNSWSFGPLALSVPLFDGGSRAAGVDAARAQFEAAVVAYRASVRQAVREVEQALTSLAAASERQAHAQTALEGYRSVFDATENSYRHGMAGLLELEETRRARLLAENSVAALSLERNTAWVELYRATGGGWSPESPVSLSTTAHAKTEP